MKKPVLFLLFIILSHFTAGRVVKSVQQQQQAWLGYFSQTRFSTHWGIWADVHLRRTHFMDRWSQQLFRAGLTYYVADNVRLTAGYALRLSITT